MLIGLLAYAIVIAFDRQRIKDILRNFWTDFALVLVMFTIVGAMVGFLISIMITPYEGLYNPILDKKYQIVGEEITLGLNEGTSTFMYYIEKEGGKTLEFSNVQQTVLKDTIESTPYIESYIPIFKNKVMRLFFFEIKPRYNVIYLPKDYQIARERG